MPAEPMALPQTVYITVEDSYSEDAYLSTYTDIATIDGETVVGVYRLVGVKTVRVTRVLEDK